MNIKKYFYPKILSCYQDYGREQLIRDIIAGIVVGIIAIPLSIAIGVSSVPADIAGQMPQNYGFSAAESGLYTAILGGLFIALFGGSRVQIGGPTGAFVVIVYGIIRNYGFDGLVVASILAGLFLIVMGFLKMGTLIKYIPLSITAGFTSGIAVVLAITQFNSFFGVSLKAESCVGKVLEFFSADVLQTVHLPTMAMGLLALVIMIAWTKFPGTFFKLVPGSLVAIVVVTLLVLGLNGRVAGFDAIATIGSQCGDLKASLPPFRLPHVTWDVIVNVAPAALTIALLASIESLLSAIVADGMIGGHHRSNTELIGQGMANIASVLFGGMPVTGAIARTAANIRSGGRTPLAGVIHSVVVLCIMLILMPYAKLIPMTVLGAVLLIVCYNMGEWRAFKEMYFSRSDFVVFLATFILTIVLDLVAAISVGMVLTSFLFMKHMAAVTKISDSLEKLDVLASDDIRRQLSKQFGNKVQLFEISGALFFGASEKILHLISRLPSETRVLVLNLNDVPLTDASGIHALQQVLKYCHNNKITLYLVNVRHQPLRMLERSGIKAQVGEQYILDSLDVLPKELEDKQLCI